MVQRRPSYVVGFVLAMLVLVAVVVVVLARDDDDAARRPAVAGGADLKVLDSRGQPLRTATRVRFAISYGTCDGTNAAEAPDPDVRLRVRIDDRREAVVVRVQVAERAPRVCAGLRRTIERRLALPQPLGRRALINGAVTDELSPRTLVNSEVPTYRRLLRTRAVRLRYLGLDEEGRPTPG